MKKIILLVSMLLASTFLFAQQDYSWLKNGLKIRYYLHEYSSNYEFVVELLEIEKDKTFNWWMTWPINSMGTCKITEDAMRHATKQQNYFRSGYLLEDDRTTGFVSYDVWKAMKDKGSITIQPVESDEVLTYVCDFLYETTLDGQKIVLPTLYCETNKGSKFWIIDNPDNPIILKMVIDFNIEIGEFMTPAYWEQ